MWSSSKSTMSPLLSCLLFCNRHASWLQRKIIKIYQNFDGLLDHVGYSWFERKPKWKTLWTVKQHSTYSCYDHKSNWIRVIYFNMKCSLHPCQSHRRFINNMHKTSYAYFIQDKVEVFYEYQMVRIVPPNQVWWVLSIEWLLYKFQTW